MVTMNEVIRLGQTSVSRRELMRRASKDAVLSAYLQELEGGES